jgi:hypothetical protein
MILRVGNVICHGDAYVQQLPPLLRLDMLERGAGAPPVHPCHARYELLATVYHVILFQPFICMTMCTLCGIC